MKSNLISKMCYKSALWSGRNMSHLSLWRNTEQAHAPLGHVHVLHAAHRRMKHYDTGVISVSLLKGERVQRGKTRRESRFNYSLKRRTSDGCTSRHLQHKTPLQGRASLPVCNCVSLSKSKLGMRQKAALAFAVSERSTARGQLWSRGEKLAMQLCQP